jgi:hypothetical protein|tara:strand:+ start:8940 stop:9434 length:495 start_codon:yes stop_codon:yes gene_type:complete
MVITYKTVHKVSFPLFLLYSEEWERADGLLFIEGRCVDDRNQVGKTLGIRRVQTPYPELYPLNKAVTSHNGILKQGTKYFIDSNGIPFIYEKTKFLHLKYLHIDKVTNKQSASLITVKGHRSPFTVPRPPSDGYDWAGILHLHGIPWMLYEYSETKLKDSKRKV